MKGILPEQVRQKISVVSFVCAVLVVALHVTEPTGCGAAFCHDWIVHGLTRISVPFFLMVSGFLLMNRAGEAGWHGRAVRQRLQTLVVPFYCSSLVGFVFLSVLPMAFGDGGSLFSVVSKAFLQGVSPIPIGFHPPMHPLWYIRALMYLTVVSPVCLAFARRSGVSAMVLLATAFGLWMLPLARSLAGTGCCIVFCVTLSCGLGPFVRNRLGRLGAVVLGGR